MLSYMLSVDEKPPPGPGKGHLQLALAPEPLTNGTSSISKETSVSSFVSDVTTATASHSSMTPSSTSDKVKPKLLINGAKHQTLKRVSFGSSKGSMVETLIFESPVQEEPEPSPIPEDPTPFPEDLEQTEDEREKVRVSFFQQSKPQEVDLPDEPIILDTDYIMAAATAINDSNHISYNRQESTDSGWDNPFRPGGDLSREADEIVELIKGGKPITPTSGGNGSPILPSLDQTDSTLEQNNISLTSSPTTVTKQSNEPITESPKKINNDLHATPKNATNGNLQNDTKPGALDVQRGTIIPQTPVDANQVEHIVIKKKPKCKCCVIQ